MFDFQLQQAGAQAWRLRLGPSVPRSTALHTRCRRLLAEFAARQGAEGLRITVQDVDVWPLGASGKLKRIFVASGT